MGLKSLKKAVDATTAATDPALVVSPKTLLRQLHNESILLALPIECLVNVFYRYLEDCAELFDRHKSLARLASVCKLFADVSQAVDPHLLVLSGISKVRDLLPELKEDPARCQRIHVVAVKTLNHGAKSTLKSEESQAKSLPEKPRRLKDIFSLLALLPNLRRVDLRVNGKRGTVEVKDLMTPLKELPCLETLESLCIDFPRAYDMNEDGFWVPRKEWIDFGPLVHRLGRLRVLQMRNLGLTRAPGAEEEDEKPTPRCRIATLEADNISDSFAEWLNNSEALTLKLNDGCLSSSEVVFCCTAVTDLTLARIEASSTTQVSMPNLVSLRATNSFELTPDASINWFSDMLMLQHMVLPIAPSRAYSRTRANTRAARTHEEAVHFIKGRMPPLATLEILSENWDTQNIASMEAACRDAGTVLTWRSLYKAK